MPSVDNNSMQTGVKIIETTLETMPGNPGVYRMLDIKGEALYVGKALNLKKRVTSYTQLARLPERLRRMVADTAAMEIVTTHTEAEALLLEANLIKKLKPRYNILLRDDKSYPWLMLTEDHLFPQITKHRGAQIRKGSYWGPFASAWSVNQTVQALQRVFLLRTCADTVFANRTRPCLLFQIKRCSAPCVGRVNAGEYGALVA
ncbi:MAG: GIY-YIG nuclease family protein, partial [Proteobacteria bacterium]|nr:GIY-YIG nuclease family protein [Pseudomonadota bacterium]